VSDVQASKLPVVGTGADASLSYVETAQLTPGRYLLRLAAMEDGGSRLGSIEQVIDATLVGGEAVLLSDLLLVDPPRSVKGRFTPVADGRMTGDEIEAFLEVYPGPGQTVRTVAFDISDTPGGPAIVGGSVGPEKRDDGRLVAGAKLELGALPAGVYMLNARVLGRDEALLGRVSRPFLLDRPAAKGAARPGAALALAATGRLVKDFAPADVLAPDVLDFFINRMHAAERGEVGEAVATAGEAIRASRFSAAIEALPGQPDGLSVAFLKGLALFGQGQLEPAAEQFRASLRIANEFLPAVFYLGACYAAGGVDREAVGAWQTSLVSESDLRIVYEVLADALVRLGDGPQAEAIVTEAQRRWPDVDVFASRLAAAHVVQNRRDDALAVLRPYLERHSNDTEALFLAIRLLYEAYDSGKPFKDAAGDRALAEKYGAQHREAGGANQALVARWISAMAR
jgi:tetratricopeptide (TPR) repeat protein